MPSNEEILEVLAEDATKALYDLSNTASWAVADKRGMIKDLIKEAMENYVEQYNYPVKHRMYALDSQGNSINVDWEIEDE